MVNFRVQGAIRSYAFGLLPGGKAAILKNQNGYKVLKEIPFDWKSEREYCVKITVDGSCLRAEVDGKVLEVQDSENPYLQGSVGMSVQKGSHCRYKYIKIGKTE